MGNHEIGRMKEIGEVFGELCMSDDLVIGCIMFKYRNIHKVTWISSDQKTKKQIDHIVIIKKMARISSEREKLLNTTL